MASNHYIPVRLDLCTKFRKSTFRHTSVDFSSSLGQLKIGLPSSCSEIHFNFGLMTLQLQSQLINYSNIELISRTIMEEICKHTLKSASINRSSHGALLTTRRHNNRD